MPLYEQSLERRRAIGDEGGVTMELYNLGAVLAAGEPAQARALLAEALERAQDEDADWLVAYCLGALGAAAAGGRRQGRRGPAASRAARLPDHSAGGAGARSRGATDLRVKDFGRGLGHATVGKSPDQKQIEPSDGQLLPADA